MPTGRPYFAETADLIRLGNDFLEISFIKSKNGAIGSIFSKIRGQEFRTNATSRPSLYLLHFIGDRELGLLVDDAAVFYHRVREVNNAIILEMFTKGFERVGGSSLTSVGVTITVYGNSSLTTWRLTVNSTENLSLDRVSFPLVNGFLSIGADSSDDYILVPGPGDTMIKDPYRSIILGRRAGIVSGPYPSYGARLQMLAVGDKDGGLYLATYDTAGHVKKFAVSRQLDYNLAITIEHLLPEQVLQTYELPYDTVLGVFSGDWYSAAEIYRQWATKQWWVQQGPFYTNPNLPAWFRNGFVMLGVLSYSAIDLKRWTAFSDVPKLAEEYAELLNVPILVRWLGWERYGNWVAPDVFPPREGWDSFRHVISELHRQGHKVMIALSAGPWDTFLPSYATVGKACVKLNRDGSEVIRQEGLRTVAWASLGCKEFRQIILNTTLALVEAGADAVNLDAMFTEPYDYRKTIDHPPGYGKWWADAAIQLLSSIRQEARRINPHFIITNEGAPELFIPYTDMYLSDDDNIRNDEWRLTTFGDSYEIVPLFEYVYHEYTLPFSRDWLFPFDEDPLGYMDRVARGIVNGVVPSFHLWLDREDWGRKYANMLYGWARDYLLRGRMLPPPELKAPSFQISVFTPNLRQWVNKTVGSVQLSRWLSPEGRQGYVIVNVRPTAVSFDINVEPLPMPDRTYSVIAVSDQKIHVIAQDIRLPTVLRVTVDPEDTLLLEVVDSGIIAQVLSRHKAFEISHIMGKEVLRVKKLGIDVNEAVLLMEGAKKAYSDSKIEEALALGTRSLIEAARVLSRFKFLLQNQTLFDSYLSNADKLLHEGRFTEAAGSALKAVSLVLTILVPSLIFDEFHTDWSTLSLDEAQRIASRIPGTEPSSFYYRELKEVVERLRYSTLRLTSEGITDRILADAELLILPVITRSISSQEVEVILDFVRKGGGLLIIGSAEMSGEGVTSMNSLVERFGLKFYQGAVRASRYLWDEGSFLVTDIVHGHRVTEGVESVIANWMVPIRLLSPNPNVTVLIYAPSDARAPELSGPFVHTAVIEYGAGRIVVMADEFVFKFEPDNTLVKNILEWLLEPMGIQKTVILDQVDPPISLVKVGSYVSVSMHAVFASSGRDAVGVGIMIDGLEYVTNSTGWLEVTAKSDTAAVKVFTPTRIPRPGSYRVLQAFPSPMVIWGPADISLMTGSEVTDVGSAATTTTMVRMAQPPFDLTAAALETVLAVAAVLFALRKSQLDFRCSSNT